MAARAPLALAARRLAATARPAQALLRRGQLLSAPAQPLRCWGPLAADLRRSPPTRTAGVRCFSSGAARQEGTVKMWNEEKGFGFLAPAAGGDDVFVHRSALGEGVSLQPGASVSYEPVWDEKKRKDRASDVMIADPGPGGGDDGGAAGGSAPAASTASGAARSHSVAGSWANWAVSKAMTSDGEEQGPLKYRMTIRKDAAKGGGADSKKEEFQILGDGSWDKRIYPAGGDKEETVLLQPGGPGSKAASMKGKGHGRNWAVEGKPGTAMDIVFDAGTQMVSCELAFEEAK